MSRLISFYYKISAVSMETTARIRYTDFIKKQGVSSMDLSQMRQELQHYYWAPERIDQVRVFSARCFALLDQTVTPEMTVMEQKKLQYQVIAREVSPVVFRTVPFYFETGALVPLSDGALFAKGENFTHAAGWIYRRNEHKFRDQDPELWEVRHRQGAQQLYLICGEYNDAFQHFNFNYRPILAHGLRGVYEQAQAALADAETPEERAFLLTACEGLLGMKTLAEKFADRAEAMLAEETDPAVRANLTRIAETARRVPWEKPESFYEALNTYAFLRKTLGTLEGAGPNTFGRLDMDLYPFYRADVDRGILTETEARDLIAAFLIAFDSHYNHNMAMVGYADHELENTYVIGGCHPDGTPLYNDLTRLFLSVTREEKIIFPKIKCRYSANSPQAYLDEIDRAVLHGTSTVLYQNDDAVIPALLRQGIPPEEARDYIVSGCWGLSLNGCEKHDHGNYVNLLKAFEISVHNRTDVMQDIHLDFLPPDDAGSFEDFYRITVENMRRLLAERMRITNQGGGIWDQVDPLPLFSSTMEGCLEQRKDVTADGGKYHVDVLTFFGFPEIVDSLMAVKTLVYEQKRYTLGRMLAAVRANWEGCEEIRQAVIACHGWGDGNDDSCAMANRFNNDLFLITESLRGRHGGKVWFGYLTYTEIRFWGERVLATLNGRKNGDYIAQGLTPSRLKRIPSATSVIRSLAALDASTMAGNNVVNMILPPVSPELFAAFLRTAAGSAAMSLQLNCTTRQQLLDARKYPERYPDLIVRVCGFSAKFTSLSPQWQDEVLSRNFYE